MDAIVTAGGIPLPEEPLYSATQGHPKALVEVAGKPMVQWVLDALSQSKVIDNVIVVGLTEKSGLKCGKKMYFVSNQGKMLENIRAGVEKTLEVNEKAKYALVVSSDIPGITGEMVDWVVNTCMETDDDVYYNVILREAMEKRYPGSKRTFTPLKDMEVCGGDMNMVRTSIVGENSEFWEKVINNRKNPAAQAALIGFDTLFLLLFRRLTIDDVIKRIASKLDLHGRALICPYPEVGMDVDKPHQLEIMRKDLKRQLKKAEASPNRKKPAKKASAKLSPRGKKITKK
jgi:GTP:adenosylcobinamide-phosphate guanylyltransferase